MFSSVRCWSVREFLMARSLAICWAVAADIGGFAALTAAAAVPAGEGVGENVTTLTATAAARMAAPATESVSRDGLRMNLCWSRCERLSMDERTRVD